MRVVYLAWLLAATVCSGYHAHGELKSKHWLLDRESIAVQKAQYTTAEVSPSSEVWRIPLGQVTTVVFSLRNVGDSRFRINATQGYLRAFHKYDMVVSPPSFHLFGEDALVHPRSEITLEWQFTPDSLIETVEFVLTLDVDYLALSDDDSALISQRYFENVMNVTVQIYDPSQHFDFQLWFLCLFLIVFTLVCSALIYSVWYIPSQLAAGHTPLSLAQIMDVAALRLRPLLGKHSQIVSYAYWSSSIAWLFGSDLSEMAHSYTGALSIGSKNDHSRRSDKSNRNAWLAGTGAKRLGAMNKHHHSNKHK